MDMLKLAAFGERLKTGGAEMGRKVSGKMKELLQGQSQEAKMVDEATSENLEEPNWGLNLRICGLLNSEQFNGSEVVRAIKKKIASKNPLTQKLSLDLLEACAMNCDKVFSEIASEKLLDDMVRMIDNPQTHYPNQRAAMQLIEAWGKSDDLAYLPIFKQTYMLELTPSVVEKCREAQPMIQRIIEGVVNDELLLFEALNLHHELQKVLSEYDAGVELPAPSSDQCGIADDSSASAVMIGDIPEKKDCGSSGGEAVLHGSRDIGKEE